MKRLIIIAIVLLGSLSIKAVGPSGMYQWSVALTGYVSTETGKAPNAYLWIPEGCRNVKAVMLAQQNMTEEALFKNTRFQKRLQKMGIGLVWVAPWFSQNWDPTTGCQQTFEEMMVGLAGQSGHKELERVPIIPFGHSAQATFPWNFAAWNNECTLCIISFHGDAPRTNLCGYGTANVEWGRTRNIDGIPGLMIEGEYEWWEARVRPALAFRMMYPESCISFLCDTGRGHFDCGDRTAEYIAKFIEKSMAQRLNADGTLKKVNSRDGWLACRYNPDMAPNDGDGASSDIFQIDKRPNPAPYADYQGDRHDAFWYFDREMAELTEARYTETRGKKIQYVGFEQEVKSVGFDKTFHLNAVYTDETHKAPLSAHGRHQPHIEVISGPVEKIDETTFRIYSYEAGQDNPKRSFNIWVAAVAEPDAEYKGAVYPIKILIKQ